MNKYEAQRLSSTIATLVAISFFLLCIGMLFCSCTNTTEGKPILGMVFYNSDTDLVCGLWSLSGEDMMQVGVSPYESYLSHSDQWNHIRDGGPWIINDCEGIEGMLVAEKFRRHTH